MATSSSQHSGPSTEKVTPTESGGDDSASEIAIGVTVPIILIVAIAVVVYWCYRRKYPVRMILGRDFGKFTNPEYRPSTGIHTLVRDDPGQYVPQQKQPTSPVVNFIRRGDDEKAKAKNVNVAFQYDSQDADEEEVERRFRQQKSNKKDEEDEVDTGHKEKRSPEADKKDEERSKKRHRPKENGRVGRDHGHDNAAYTEDSDVDSVSAEDTDKTKDDKSDSESTSSDVSISSDKPNRPNSSEAGDKSGSDKQNNKGGSSDEEYHSGMTVIEFPQKAQNAEKKGESHEADEKRGEPFSPQMAQDLCDSGIEKVSGMTVREFLKFAKEKRAMSDVTRVRAGSLTTPYDIVKSARRRAQSAEDFWEKAAEPFKSDEKLLPKNSNKTGTSRGSDSISLNDADFDRGSLDSFHRHEEEFEQDDVLHWRASRNDPSNEPTSDSDDAADSSGLVESNRNIEPRPLQIGETSPVKMKVELEDEDTETQPMELSFTTEPRDSKFPPNPELPPGALQLTSSATNEPAASRVIQLKSSPPQPTRLRGLAALKMHPNLRSRSSDSDSDSDGAELTAEDIEAALGEGSEASSDEEPGPTSPPMNAGKVKLQVDPKEILALGEDTDDDEIDV